MKITQTILFIDFLGANYELTNEDIDHCKDAICQADLVMIHMGPAIMDVATHMIELANECHTPVLVTPSVMTADVPLHFWKKVDYLAMNLAQAAAISCLSGENAKTARISASILSNQVRQGRRCTHGRSRSVGCGKRYYESYGHLFFW